MLFLWLKDVDYFRNQFLQTCCESNFIFIFIPESVTLPVASKLVGDNTAERGADHPISDSLLSHTTSKKIDVINMPETK